MRDKTIPLSVPNLRGNELKYITAAIETEWVSTGGPYVDEFEQKIAEYVHAKGAVSCQNGTAGIHIALMAAGITDKDIVIVPALTFIASVNPVSYIGAEPVFMDCDDSLCLDPVKLRRFCEESCEIKDGKLIDKLTGKQVKAVLAVHIFGNMADMDAILEIASQYHIKVVEDAAEAVGTYYTTGKWKGRYAGTLGDVGIYSFNGNKIITTGGGGMIVSHSLELLKQARHLTTQAKSDEVYYTHDTIGYNYRMSNLQAALGLAQLEQLEEFIETKERNYMIYQENIASIEGLKLLPFRRGTRSNRWFYGIYCEDAYPLNRDELIAKMTENRIQTRPIWGLISDQPPYKGMRAFEIIRAKEFWGRVVNVPCSTNLKEEDILDVCQVLKER